MNDINGIEIKVGDTVKTQQPCGGFLPPSLPTEGVVEIHKDGDLVIRYRKDWRTFDQFISLKGQINEILKSI